MNKRKPAFSTVLLLVCILSAGAQTIPPDQAGSSKPGLDSAARDRIESVINGYLGEAPIPGLVVSLVRADALLYSRGFGSSSGRQLTPESSMGIADLTKVFTSLAALRLSERGLLDLEARVVTILPWFRTSDKASSDRITIRMLLQERSGLPATYAYLFNRDNSPLVLEQWIRGLASVKLLNPPDTVHSASNYNYDLLGLIMATITGKSFEDMLAGELIAPLGLRRSGIHREAIDRLAPVAGNFIHYEGFTPSPEFFYRRVSAPSGSALLSSASDLSRLVRLLLGQGSLDGSRFVSTGSLGQFFEPRSNLAPGSISGSASTGYAEQGSMVFRHISEDKYHLDILYSGTNWTSAMLVLDRVLGVGLVLLFPYEARMLDPYRFTPPVNLAYNILRAFRGDAPSGWARPSGTDPLMAEAGTHQANARWLAYLPATLHGDDGGTIDAWIEDGQLRTVQKKAGREIYQRIAAINDTRAVNDSLLYRRKIAVVYNNAGVPLYLTINGVPYRFRTDTPPQGSRTFAGWLSGSRFLLPESSRYQLNPKGFSASTEDWSLECRELSGLESNPESGPHTLLAALTRTALPPPAGAAITQLMAGHTVRQWSYDLPGGRLVSVLIVETVKGKQFGLLLETSARTASALARDLILPLFQYSVFP